MLILTAEMIQEEHLKTYGEFLSVEFITQMTGILSEKEITKKVMEGL